MTVSAGRTENVRRRMNHASFYDMKGFMLVSLLVVLCMLANEGDAWSVSPLMRMRNGDVGHRRRMSLSSASSKSSLEDVKNCSNEDDSGSSWANVAMLISSFSDGVVSSPNALEFLKHGLTSVLFQERIRQTESALSDSVLFSPCAGPDIQLLEKLEYLDGQQQQKDDDSMLQQALWKAIRDEDDDEDEEITLRILYIPTAMYALRSDSQNTPGKQRQRARADGKKRREQLIQTIQNMFQPEQKLSIHAVTLDLDDASVKQPFGSDDANLFPKNGKEAFDKWKPHLIYVEGGNTFWLYHCMEKGDWENDIKNACCGPNAYAFYCGKSAGAILAGATVETATWKGWDDPSVVPGKDSYDDWIGTPGLNMVGGANIFPHMSSDWNSLVEEKRTTLDDDADLFCLEDWEACLVNGQGKTTQIVKGEMTTQ
jgi:hypothetical protein